MELRQLKYFKEACELQNFSEAARVLHISQSTLSQQIKQLEDELDVLLFDRIGKRIVPTEAGLAFLPYAVRAIRDAENGKQIIRDLKGIETGSASCGSDLQHESVIDCSVGIVFQNLSQNKGQYQFCYFRRVVRKIRGKSVGFCVVL